MIPDEVRERLGFAGRRMNELLALNGGNLAGADGSERQQFVQEFFFHLVGTVEVLAQLTNERRGLGLDVEDVSASRVIQMLPQGDALRASMERLYKNTRPGKPVPTDPYSDNGVLYRIWNYRHQVTHRRRNPFRFTLELATSISVGAPPTEPASSLFNRFRRFFRPSLSSPPDSGQTPTGHFIIDPRDPNSLASTRTAQEEMERMLDLMTARCEKALRLLP